MKNNNLFELEEFLPFLTISEAELFNKMYAFVVNRYGKQNVHSSKGQYIFVQGELPVCLVAHMDVVYSKPLAASSICLDSRSPKKLWSPDGIRGDDRCGVYAIYSLIKNGGLKPSVILTCGEEIGCVGAIALCTLFKNMPELYSSINAFIELDRRGKGDIVRYSDHNVNLTNTIYINTDGFYPNHGSCSDISVLMTTTGISGVNLSVGYYNEHCGSTEHIILSHFKRTISTVFNLLTKNINAFKCRYKYDSGFTPVHPSSTPVHSSSRFSNNPVSKPVTTFSSHNDRNITKPMDGLVKDVPLCETCGAVLQKEYNYCPICGDKIDKNSVNQFKTYNSSVVSSFAYDSDYNEDEEEDIDF